MYSAEAASRGRDLLESQLQELRRLREESTEYTHGLEEEVSYYSVVMIDHEYDSNFVCTDAVLATAHCCMHTIYMYVHH